MARLQSLWLTCGRGPGSGISLESRKIRQEVIQGPQREIMKARANVAGVKTELRGRLWEPVKTGLGE